MEPRRYGMAEEKQEKPDDKLPYWMRTPVMLAMQIGPMVLIGLTFIPVILGWISTPMLAAIEKSNAELARVREVYTEVAKTQTAMANSQKATAEAATARDARAEAMQLKMEALAKGNRMQCRALAKLLKNADMNERCDEL